MGQITDDVLISFCDFMNLPVKWTDVGKERKTDGTIETYHTIASLIETEYMGIDKRQKDGMTDKSIIYIPWSEREKKEFFDDPHKGYHSTGDTLVYRKKVTEYLEKNKRNILGTFYKKIVREYKYSDLSTLEGNNSKRYHILNEYIFKSKEEMRDMAPVVTEQYDRYTKNKSGSIYKYLDEYEIIGMYDNHEACPESVCLIYEEPLKAASKQNAKKLSRRELLSSFPTKEEVDNKMK